MNDEGASMLMKHFQYVKDIDNMKNKVFVSLYNDKKYIIKKIKKESFKENEELVPRNLDTHKEIVKISEMIMDKYYVYLIMPYHEDSDDLFNITIKEEYNIRKLIQDMTRCIYIIHLKNIAHLDIKLENFIRIKDYTGEYLQLIDFEHATVIKNNYEGIPIKGYGTLEYVPPEQKMGRAFLSSDIWSLGVCVYILYFNKGFSYENYKKEMIDNIMVREFLAGCLIENPRCRYNIQMLYALCRQRGFMEKENMQSEAL